MSRYFIDLSFNGSQFHGWQRQKNAVSVQQTIEEGLSTILRKEMEITGAGRTDTGVHARQMIAHFDLEGDLGDPDRLQFQLDGILGSEIAIHSIRKVKEDAHARFDASGRTYFYHLLQRKDPFFKELAYHHLRDLDFFDMNKAAQYLLGKQDFSSFSRSNTQTKTNLCTVEKAEWKEVNEQWVFEIKADRFLRNMVRAIVGTLLEIGEGKRSVEEMKEVIAKQDRKYAGVSAPAHGLYLVHIDYPNSIYL